MYITPEEIFLQVWFSQCNELRPSYLSVSESKGSLQNFLYLKWIQGLLFSEISKHVYIKGKINTWSSFKIEYEKKRSWIYQT